MIRAATPADLPALRALQSLLPASSPQLLTTALRGPGVVLVSVGEASGRDAGDVPGAVAGCDAPPDNAAADDLPVGYVLAMNGPQTAHVAELVVAPSHRREGRGRRLLAAALDSLHATDATAVELAVEPNNDAARRLYGEFGFEEKTRVADYYEDGGSAVLMRRQL